MRWWKRTDAECAAIADQLVIPQPFNLEAFCDGIAEQRGRPLILLPLDGPPDPALPCGIWLGLDVADLVFYDAVAAEILKVQIVLHEISHMLLGHVAPELDLADQPSEGELALASEHFQRLLARTHGGISGIDRPDLPVAAIIRAEAARIRAMATMTEAIDEELGLDFDRIAHLMGRSKFATPQERKAETLATLIHERASRYMTQSTSTEAEERLVRLHDALGHPVRNTWS
ncbi:hypothetical protein CIB93_30720 [Streptomyces sp. WZ.A104]|jgi:hypothetical protein|uniref:hypothetical protein n=1 Tax=Streptomyces sp. WZ.A104 TaxID=2023771 RepID=UPI000BBC8F0E|nr:hypothetical protein [Streptomyces sp. WZ.A104]PCG82285.1 hypothetical protein CIB93_30720 [Streptomyces sp. WZ.A104]